MKTSEIKALREKLDVSVEEFVKTVNKSRKEWNKLKVPTWLKYESLIRFPENPEYIRKCINDFCKNRIDELSKPFISKPLEVTIVRRGKVETYFI